jgi:hypothetical protein
MNIPAKVTPLWIVAAFVTLTETVLGYAITKVTDGVQIALTVFVICFALLVATAFFVILWNRPYVFYPPSEYGNTNPETFVSALRQGGLSKTVVEQVKLAASVGQNPKDKIAQFALIDGMLDEVHRQYLILMHVIPCDVPYTDSYYNQDIYEMEYGSSVATGGFDSRKFLEKIDGTGFISIISKGPKLSLTQSGHDFAQWLIDNGHKASFIKTSLGGWGEPRPDGPIFQMRAQRAQRMKIPQVPAV